MNIRKRYSQRKAHKLFENEQHVDRRATSSLLDEALWQQADTLNDDADEVASNIPGESILSKPTPQLENRNDENKDPRRQYEEQETIHGEPDMNVLDKNLSREVQTEPQQGEMYPGRDHLLKNNQPNQQSNYGGGMTEDYMPARAQKKRLYGDDIAEHMGFQDIVQKMNPFAIPVAFDLFIDMVGNHDTLTQEQIRAMNPKLTKLLLDAGILQEGEYAVDRSKLDAITERMRNVGRDFSKVSLKELQEYISTTQMNNAAPSGAGAGQAGGAGAGGGAAPQQPTSQQQNIQSMLSKVGAFKLADIKDKIQVSDAAKRYIDIALAQDPQMDLNTFTSLTTENFRTAQYIPTLEPEEQDLLAPDEDEQQQEQVDIPAIQQEVLEAVYAISDELLASQELNTMLEQEQAQQQGEERLTGEQTVVGEPIPEPQAEQQQNKTLRQKVYDWMPESVQKFHKFMSGSENDMQKMTVEDVRKLSPVHARRMESAGIEWVDGDLYMKAYKKQMREAIKTASSATRTAFKLRSKGRTINEVIGLVSHGAKMGKYSQRDADVACVMMHRLAQLTCANKEDITYDDLIVETNSAVERLAAKSEVSIPVYIKTAAKQIRAVDHTLYSMDHGGTDSDFNYADPWDVNWTLYRGSEGKKGGKVHTCKSPAQAMSLAKTSGDGNYLVVGESILDDAYWGTYTIKVEKGIVVNYAKIPVDEKGKRVAGKKDNNKVVQARRRYVAIYKALSKRKLIAQSEQFYNSPYKDWPKSDEEIDARYDEALEEDKQREVVRQKVDDWIRRLDRELMQRHPQEVGEFPTQEEADQRFDEMLAANPEVLKTPQAGE